MNSRLKAALLAATYLTVAASTDLPFPSAAALPWTPDAPQPDHLAIPSRSDVGLLSASGAIRGFSGKLSGTPYRT